MRQEKVQVATYQKAKRGNHCCGDSYFYKETDREFICVLSDGLGSGKYAKQSSQIVVDIIKDHLHVPIEQLTTKLNEQLLGRRGVVLGILKMNFDEQRYSFSSIGNIGVMTITNGERKRMIPSTGYLAGFQRPFKKVIGKIEPEMTFLLFSDGVTDRDLSQRFLLNTNANMDELIQQFTAYHQNRIIDDTTLIAMHYRGSKD